MIGSGPALAADGASTETAPAEDVTIVVTGEKQDRTLQQTPSSVAVATGRTIVDQNLISVYDVLDRMANVVVNGNRTSFSIRGIDASNVLGGGDGALASVYLDGAVLPKAALVTGPLDLTDIAQVEVFRGPQSTVQGRNALAGAVIIRTADPSYDWSGRARLLLADKTGERRASAAIGGPIVDGQIAFRLAGEIARSDGLVRNVNAGGDADRRKSETLRGKLLFTPAAVPGLRVVATYMHDRHRRGGLYVELQPPYAPEDRVSTSDLIDVTEVKSDIATLDIGYDLGSGLTLKAVGNYSHIRSHYAYDPDHSADPGQIAVIDDPNKTYQQELRLNVDWNWLQGLIGAYYLRDDNRGYFFGATQNLSLRRLGVDQSLLKLGLPQATVDTVINLYGSGVPIVNSLDQPRVTQNHAAFADFTVPITTRLRLRAGLRYDRESQRRGIDQRVAIDKPLPDPAAYPGLGPIIGQINGLLQATAAAATSYQPERTVRYHAWLPKIGLSYDVMRDMTLSLTARRGYRAGGSGLNQQRGQVFVFNPEFTWNYELALRSAWFDRRLTFNANLYRIDWKDQQVSVQLTPGSAFDKQVINAGRSRLYGLEAEFSARPTATISLGWGAGYSRTKFTDFDVGIGQVLQSAAGNEFPNAPRWTLFGSVTWQHPSGLFANINARYRSAFYQSALVQTHRDIRPLTLANAKLGWQGEHLGAFLIVSNIFNVEKPVTSALDPDGRLRGMVSEPRVMGLSFEGRF
ncbi:TonB-dependent receptor [Flavisphingomonas formosensis]|uniref:TonB-dependent receptor n=1 Tax=Flavisphingomonas formosensis TaxID=861534 RepID=UPI0012F9752B|nr:TonB-dependent receptor [Sphingomonas formosensis]